MIDSKQDQDCFSEIIKKAYEKGLNEKDITVDQILQELELDLQLIFSRKI
ncbi:MULTISPECIES: hypothetical protein [Bacillus]|nr:MULTISPECIES: hypothetical protein [Bacillus]